MFIYELSTLSFWIEHKGAWYVAALLPIYMIYPIFFKWTEKSNRKAKHIVIIISIIIAEIILSFVNINVYNHLSQVLNSLWVFVLGNYYAKKIKTENNNVYTIIPVFLIVFLADKLFLHKHVLISGDAMYALKGVLLCVMLAWGLHLINACNLNKILMWFGNHSLMLYLTNIFLIQFVNYFNIDMIVATLYGRNGNCIVYVLITLLGLVLTSIVDSSISKITKRIA